MFVLIAGTVAVCARDVWACGPDHRGRPGHSSPKSANCRAVPPLSMRAQRRTSRRFSFPPNACAASSSPKPNSARDHARAHFAAGRLDRERHSGPVLIGPALNPDMVCLQNFLARNGYPIKRSTPTKTRTQGRWSNATRQNPRSCRLPFAPTEPFSKIRAQRSSRIASA